MGVSRSQERNVRFGGPRDSLAESGSATACCFPETAPSEAGSSLANLPALWKFTRFSFDEYVLQEGQVEWRSKKRAPRDFVNSLSSYVATELASAISEYREDKDLSNPVQQTLVTGGDPPKIGPKKKPQVDLSRRGKTTPSFGFSGV